MHFNIEKTIGCIVGLVLFLKIVFVIFSPTEMVQILTISLVAFAAYGVQRVEWNEGETWTVFGICVYQNRRVLSQWTICGLIPISKAVVEENSHAIIPNSEDAKVIGNLFISYGLPFILSVLPFGGYRKLPRKLR